MYILQRRITIKPKEDIMQIYQCPNCGRTYSEFENVYYCGTCNYRLVKKEDIKSIKNNVVKNNSHVIGRIQDPTKPIVTCPYCKSTNTTKISGISKAGSVVMFGIFSQKVKKQWHCNDCKSDF